MVLLPHPSPGPCRAGLSGQSGLNVTWLESRSVSASASFCSLGAASVRETLRRAGPAFDSNFIPGKGAEILISVNKTSLMFQEEMIHGCVGYL